MSCFICSVRFPPCCTAWLASLACCNSNFSSVQYHLELVLYTFVVTCFRLPQPVVLDDWEEAEDGSFSGLLSGQRGLADGTAVRTAAVDASGELSYLLWRPQAQAGKKCVRSTSSCGS